MSVKRAALFRNLDFFTAGQVLACNTAFHFADIFDGALCNQLTAVDTCAGSNIHNPIRFTHGFFIVFHNDQGITKVTQAFQSGNQLGIIALMKANAGLVQNIKNTGQRTSDLSG